MKIFRRGISPLRGTLIALAVAATLVVAPSAAVAAFSASAQAPMYVSAAKIVAPAAAATSVSTSCSMGQSRSWATFTVNSYGKVAGANYYELKIVNPQGTVAYDGDLSTALGTHFSFVGWTSNVKGTWTYEIRGYYKVPGTANAWAGDPLSGTLVCS